MEQEFDEIDAGIIRLLQEDARLSNKQLAYKLNRSPNPIYIRVKRLEEAGIIKRYTAIIDNEKIGLGMTVITQVTLKQHSQAILNRFFAEVEKIPEVVECFHMTGNFDFTLKIILKDLKEYHTLLMEKLGNLPEVGTIESSFVMAEVKNTNIRPI